MTTDAYRPRHVLGADVPGFTEAMRRVALSFEALGRAADVTARNLGWAAARWTDASAERGRARALRRQATRARARHDRYLRGVARYESRETPARSAMHAAYRHRARRR